MVSGAFRMVSDGPGHSRKVREGPGQKLRKVEKQKSKNDKIMVSAESLDFGVVLEAKMAPKFMKN